MRGGRGVSTTMITKAHHQTHQEDQYMIGGGGGLGLSWPPRFYTCNFCRREFRSAQALGGHMNVHRRDRARLRSSSITTPKVITPNPNPNPNLNLNLIPNPNPTQPTLPFSVPSPSTQKSCVFPRYKHVSHGVSPQCPSIFEPKKLLVMTRQGNLRAKVENGGYNLNKGRSVVRLGLEIGIFDDDDEDKDEDEEDLEDGLDLELRLGYNH